MIYSIATYVTIEFMCDMETLARPKRVTELHVHISMTLSCLHTISNQWVDSYQILIYHLDRMKCLTFT